MIDYKPPERRGFFGFVTDIGIIVFGGPVIVLGNLGNIACTKGGAITLVAAGILCAIFLC